MMNSVVKDQDKSKISVELTPDEALALTGARYNDNHEVQAAAKRKIRTAFEKTFDFQQPDR